MKKISIFLLSAFFACSVFVLPIFAEDNVTTSADVPLSSEEITCMTNAITVRDEALTKAYDVYAAAVSKALASRTDALLAAWEKGSMSQIKTESAKAWQTYRRSLVTARIALRRVKISSWKEYRTARTTCLTGNAAGLDTTDVKSDAQL